MQSNHNGHLLLLLVIVIAIIPGSGIKAQGTLNRSTKQEVKSDKSSDVSIIKISFGKMPKINDYDVHDIERGQKVLFQLDSINTFKYKVDFQFEDTTHSKSINFPNFDVSVAKELGEMLSGIGKGALSVSSFGQMENQLNLLSQDPSFESEGDETEAFHCDDHLIATKLIERESKLNSILDKILGEKFKLIGHLNRIKNAEENFIVRYPVNMDIPQWDAVRLYLEQIYRSAQRINYDLDTLPDLKLAFFEDCPYGTNNEIINEKITYLDAISDSLKNDLKRLGVLLSPDRISKIIRPLLELEEHKSQKMIIGPLQLRSERLDFRINLYAKEDTASQFPLAVVHSSFPKVPKTYIGVGGSFFINTIKNDNISIVTDTLGASNVIPEATDKFELGFMTPFYFGCKLNNKIGLHGLVAPGVVIGRTIRPRLLFGGGAAIGRRNNFTLNIGLALGYADIESNVTDIPNQLVNLDTAVVSKLKHGFFFSVGHVFQN